LQHENGSKREPYRTSKLKSSHRNSNSPCPFSLRKPSKQNNQILVINHYPFQLSTQLKIHIRHMYITETILIHSSYHFKL
jgi:hypothetical protein